MEEVNQYTELGLIAERRRWGRAPFWLRGLISLGRSSALRPQEWQTQFDLFCQGLGSDRPDVLSHRAWFLSVSRARIQSVYIRLLLNLCVVAPLRGIARFPARLSRTALSALTPRLS